MRVKGRSRRRGIAELVATVLAIAVTVIAGAAVFGFVNSQAAQSESALASNAGSTNSFLSEHFGIIDMYFGSTSSATFWVYNTGSVALSVFSVRFYGSGGSINLYFNYTMSGAVPTDYVYDLRSVSAGLCRTAASSYESPSIGNTTTNPTNAAMFTITIPPSLSGCPSYGNILATGHTYTLVVTGLYGNVVTYSQTM